jgi:hypothetical protein
MVFRLTPQRVAALGADKKTGSGIWFFMIVDKFIQIPYLNAFWTKTPTFFGIFGFEFNLFA